MGKAKEIKLPKYLKLNKGAMWFDTDEDDPKSSGIRLFNTDVKFVGRGFLSPSEMAQYRKTGITPKKPIGQDMHKNQDTTHNAYGYVIEEKDKSYFCTEEVPKDKLANILTAYNNNILISHNPKAKKKVTNPKEVKNRPKNFEYQDGDVVFIVRIIGSVSQPSSIVRLLSPQLRPSNNLYLLIVRLIPSGYNDGMVQL